MSRYEVQSLAALLKSSKSDSARLATFKEVVDAGRCCYVSCYDPDWLPITATFLDRRQSDTAWAYMVDSKQYKADEEQRQVCFVFFFVQYQRYA